ncbi:MAG: hypothetical protein J0H66_14925 [Solirubrobacterales bacterium]|nr:hypothetical protein [Solirubrobacterales bacterium]OJU95976.1 MAG: hypothetical protein BGO23_10440 [Solirubrobacterales bacterium 67-14]
MHIFAYLDPGSVSAALAAVLAGVAGIGAAFRTFGSNLKKKLFFWKKDEETPEAAATATAAPAETPEDKPAEQ